MSAFGLRGLAVAVLAGSLLTGGVAPALGAPVFPMTVDPPAVAAGKHVRGTVPFPGAFSEGLDFCAAFLDGTRLSTTCGAEAGERYVVEFDIPVRTPPGPHDVAAESNAFTARSRLQVLPDPLSVPDLRGLRYPAAAEQAAKDAGLAICPVHRTDGIVVGQDPLPGPTSTFPRCLVVNVVDAVTVPSVIGRSLPDAQRVVGNAGLVLGTPPTTDGTIATQDPGPNTVVAAGSEVRVTMTGAGPHLVPVPDVLGRTVREARSLVSAAGLRLRNGGSHPGRRVRTQKPQPGTMVESGSAVAVILQPVSARLVAVPDLRGQTVDEARETLAGEGLVLADPPADAGNDAHVTGQSPAAAALVSPRTPVKVTLEAPVSSSGPTAVVAGLLALAVIGGVAFVRRPRPPAPPSDRALRPRPRRPDPTVHLVARADIGEVHLLSSSGLVDARVTLQPHLDTTGDPQLVEVVP
jgi:hypothetical protein